MNQYTSYSHQERRQHSIAVFGAELLVGMFISVAFIFGVYYSLANASNAFQTSHMPYAMQNASHSTSNTSTLAAVVERHVNVNLRIVINQQGLHRDWPAYTPSNIVIPANSIVTVTLRNYDLGDTPLQSNSPFTRVQGTMNGTASVDGIKYSSLAPDKIAHTFTVPQLNLNVPVPGDAPQGASYNTVTFTFKTGNAGSYTFQCFDPCGTGMMGWMGPMMTKGYMIGTLTVQ